LLLSSISNYITIRAVKMADLDEELLALAGDASEEEDDAPQSRSRESSESGDNRTPGKGSNGRKRHSARHSDSEEEGEA
jgi:RNA polymerase-associated protein RTF1